MRVGVDACSWSNARGYGRFTRELLRALVQQETNDEWIFFLDPQTAEQFDIDSPSARSVVVKQDVQPTQAASATGYRSPTDMLRFTRSVYRHRPDVFFSPSVYTYFPLPLGLPAVVAIHDAIAERFPQLTHPKLRARLFWRAKVHLALWQSRLIVTVSEYAASQLADVLHVPRSRIRITNEAPAAVYRPSSSADVKAASARAGIPTNGKWFIYVGGFNPHKNVDVIIRAHATIASEFPTSPPHLILVGQIDGDAFHSDRATLVGAIDEAGTEGLVHWTGYLPDSELRHLHTGALALLLPSMCEGFGLPAIEAAACKTAVIATTASPLPQLLKGGGIFVEPGDQIQLENALRSLLIDETARAAMSQRAHELAAAHTWPRTARSVLDALHEAVS